MSRSQGFPGGAEQPGGTQWDEVEEARALLRGWALAVVQHLGRGLRSPADLLDAINREQAGISDGRDDSTGSVPQLLSRKGLFEALARLRGAGLVDGASEPGVPPRAEYWLTRQGHDILTAATALAEDPPPVPGVNTTISSPARVLDAIIGGKDNFAVDREQAAAVVRKMPSLPLTVRLVRQFQTAAIQRLIAGEGVRQFLDIGTGLPVAGAVHEVAQRAAPESRVVYVDNDPMVLAHARALLRSSPEGACDYIDADLRDPERILAAAAGILDMGKPVAIILSAVLHFITDDEDPWSIVRCLAHGVRGPAYLVLYHAAADGATARAATEEYNARSPVRFTPRSRQDVERLFTVAGFSVLAPGVEALGRWWPEQAAGLPPDVNGYLGIGQRPALARAGGAH